MGRVSNEVIGSRNHISLFFCEWVPVPLPLQLSRGETPPGCLRQPHIVKSRMSITQSRVGRVGLDVLRDPTDSRTETC